MKPNFSQGGHTADHESNGRTPSSTDVCTRRNQRKKLIATWANREDNDIGTPEVAVWEDGSPATIADFRKHELDTHFWIVNENGQLEKHMFPDIVGQVTFDQNLRDWVVRGEGVITAELDLKNPGASESEIIAALFLLPIYYHSAINR